MNLMTIHAVLSQNLKEHLFSHLPREKQPQIKGVYEYALFPPGKLFRPLLVWAVGMDCKENLDFHPKSDHALLASCVEFHHAYSLIHDDLPCMDNGLERRGKPCVHLAFKEWKALLVGDGLLNLSYQILSRISSPALPEIFRLMGGLLGPKGLIHGQVMDLSGEMRINFETLVETHKLKTARLIQFSLLSSYILAHPHKITFHQFKEIYKLGHWIGIVFQFLDDLTDLSETEYSEHENSINPWLNFKEQTENELIKGLAILKKSLNNLNLIHLKMVMEQYFKSTSNYSISVKGMPLNKVLKIFN